MTVNSILSHSLRNYTTMAHDPVALRSAWSIVRSNFTNTYKPFDTLF